MKVGIITLWQSSDNYGQQLQCWALQQELIKLGYEPYLIRYDVEYQFSSIKSPLWKKITKLLLIYPVVKSFVRKKREIKEQKLRVYNALRNSERDFENFRKDNIYMSEKTYTSLKSLKDNPPKAAAYIVGSDQVWAFLLDRLENQVMFLDFGQNKTKRVAYAPSFSMPAYPDKLKAQLKFNLSRFDSLSVREQTGANICKELGFEAKVVLDPTMLLKREDYSKIASTNTRNAYIYLYYLNITNPKEVEWKQLQEFSKAFNLKIIATPASGYIQGEELFSDVDYQYATIPQWIGLINNANLVVTTSFHGVVFCVLHHTPFVFFPLKGKFSRGNNRVIDLCNLLHLSDRIWTGNLSFISLYEDVIDWKKVDQILDTNRMDSIAYLSNNLKSHES